MAGQQTKLPEFTPLAPEEISPALANSPCAACTVRQQSVCAALDDNELERLAGISRAMYVAAGSTIFNEGDPAEYLFNVTDGVIKLYKLLADGREQVTGFLFPGDFIGLALRDSYSYSAEALSAVRLCKMQRSQFREVLAATPRLEHRLLSVASNELAQAQDQMLLLGRKTAREKIVSFFLQLAERRDNSRQAQINAGAQFADDEFDEDVVDLPMGRADIADYLGLTTETVSRTLTQLKTDGSIQLLDNHKVRLSSRDGLQDIAQGL